MTHDVAVVGGGIVGLSSAYELARAGFDVVVIDRDAIGAGCAIGSAGHIVPSHVVPLAAPGAVRSAVGSLVRKDGPLSVRWGMGPSMWGWLATFANRSRGRDLDASAAALSSLSALSVRLIDEWIDRHGIECHQSTLGLLDVYGDEQAFEGAVHHAMQAEGYGVNVEVLDGPAVRTLEPAINNTAIGAVRFPDDRNMNPAQFLSGLRGAVESLGVTLRSDTELVDIKTSDRTVTSLSTTKGDIAAQYVVIATGAWSGRLAKMLHEKIPILPGRGFSVTVDRPLNGPTHAMLLGEKHVAIGPMGDQLRLSGRFELGRFGTTPDPKRIADIERLARSRLDFDEQLNVRETWAGLRPVSPDGVPIISKSSTWDNVTIATGHAMIGLSIGPGTGRVVAHIVAGDQAEFDTGRFSIARFQ